LIEVVAETGSTNADLLRRVAVGELAPELAWLVADRQVSGRGRQGRVWSDDAGNFMGSTVVHLRTGDPAAHTLSLVAGLAAYSAIEQAAPNLDGLTLKWPNDILIGEAKLAGILLERSGDTVVVGVGVNLMRAPSIAERAVVCLADHDRPIARDVFAEYLEKSWELALQRWRCGGWDHLRSDWIARAHPFGTPLMVHGPAGEALRGSFAGIDHDGALQLILAGGTRRTIHAGEVDLDHRC
jgi:BirA family biotin operon repressor/biotin-[acetyl-CoA-carboxylase] ligase